MFFYRKRDMVGVDIGSNSVKLIQLKPAKKGYELLKLGIAPLPHEVIVENAIMNASVASDVIRSLLASQKISRAKDAVSSVSGHSVIIKKILLPIMEAKELKESITFDAEQYIPFDINDVNLDFRILRNSPDEEGQMEVLLVAAKTEMLDDLCTVLTEAGLHPMMVDVDAFAVQNMFEYNYSVEEGKTFALINIGASLTNINIVSDGLSNFVRDINVGGNLYTEEIQKRLNITFEEAEELKLGGTLQVEEGETTQAEEGSQEVSGILNLISENLAIEIQRSLDFYVTTGSGNDIARIYLTGGTTKIPGLAAMLANKIGIETEIMNPLKNIAFNEKLFERPYLESVAPLLGVVVGLGLRQLGDRND